MDWVTRVNVGQRSTLTVVQFAGKFKISNNPTESVGVCPKIGHGEGRSLIIVATPNVDLASQVDDVVAAVCHVTHNLGR